MRRSADKAGEVSRSKKRALLLLRRVDRILARHPEVDRENVRHTLLLLEETPVERLERGLSRGRALDLHR